MSDNLDNDIRVVVGIGKKKYFFFVIRKKKYYIIAAEIEY